MLLTSHTGIIKRLLETCLSHISPIATVLIGSSQSKLLWSFHAHPDQHWDYSHCEQKSVHNVLDPVVQTERPVVFLFL